MEKADILVVDDSLSIRRMVEFALRSHGYKTAGAQDGREALEKLVRNDYKLVLLDINMPHLDGFGLLKWLRADEKLADTPVIMLTTENKPSDRERAMTLGARAYINKPFKPSELIDRVNEVLKDGS